MAPLSALRSRGSGERSVQLQTSPSPLSFPSINFFHLSGHSAKRPQSYELSVLWKTLGYPESWWKCAWPFVLFLSGS